MSKFDYQAYIISFNGRICRGNEFYAAQWDIRLLTLPEDLATTYIKFTYSIDQAKY